MGKETSSSSLKKKRKTAIIESVQEIDIYRRVVDFEEKEALNRDTSLDAEIFHRTCQDIRNMLKEICDIKMGEPSAKNLPAKDIATDIFMKLCVIKKLNRTDKIKHVVGKDRLNIEKQKCDTIKLTYQNLVYELHHLVTETNKCLAFKSMDEEIELVSFEDFMRNAPETLSKKFEQYDEENREQRHNLRLARLEWELMQRKNLAQLCKSLVEQQKKLGKDLAERKEKLKELRPLLTNIINATKPLQSHLDIPFSELRIEHNLALLLPDPLYIFYVNVVSYKSVYNLNVAVEISGEEEEANLWREALENSIQDEEEEEESDQDIETQESEEVVEVKKRRHRKSVQQVDPMEEKKKKLLEVHPLQVEITMKLENGPSLIVTFSYHPKLGIVTVTSKSEIPPKINAHTAREIMSGENILSELFSGDLGTDSPNPVTSYQLRKIGISSYESVLSDIGYAYQWAQRVCGIDFLTRQINSNAIGSINVESVTKTLFRRLRTKFDIARQLQQLEQNILPNVPDKVGFSTSPVSSLAKWTSCTYQKFCKSEATRDLIEDFVIPTSLIYLATIERGSALLHSYVVIGNNYPEVPPIFSLSLACKGEVLHSKNTDDIRDMERALNSGWEHGSQSSPWLLAAQITYLCFLLDVYLETGDTKTFKPHVTFIKNICGRNRKRPFKFQRVGTGIFTQY